MAVDERDRYPLSDSITGAWEDSRMFVGDSPATRSLAVEARDYAVRRADALEARVAELERELREAVIERDEMRRANVTPEDAGRPLGQSVEYWQDRCLDHATHLDRSRVRVAELERELSARQP